MDELVKELRDERNKYQTWFDTSDALDDIISDCLQAAEAIESLQAQLEHVMAELEAERPDDNWNRRALDVVMCKECDMWNDWDSHGHIELNNFRCSCAHWSNEDGYICYTAPDDFCSCGQRRESEKGNENSNL